MAFTCPEENFRRAVKARWARNGLALVLPNHHKRRRSILRRNFGRPRTHGALLRGAGWLTVQAPLPGGELNVASQGEEDGPSLQLPSTVLPRILPRSLAKLGRPARARDWLIPIGLNSSRRHKRQWSFSSCCPVKRETRRKHHWGRNKSHKKTQEETQSGKKAASFRPSNPRPKPLGGGSAFTHRPASHSTG